MDHQNVVPNSALSLEQQQQQQPSSSSPTPHPSSVLLPPFHSLHSSSSTDEALAAMEKTTLGPEPPPIDSMGQADAVSPSTGVQQLSTDWRSLYVCTLLAFCTSVQFSLYFSSMWPYFQILDSSASERFFGYIVAVYSLGQLLGSPLVGYISNRLRMIRHLLYAGLFLMFTGNALYLTTHLFPGHKRKFVLLLARFITGLGSSNISLLKAYASTASTQPDRSRAIAFVTGGVALGMTMGPAFQLLFTPFGFPGLVIFPGFRKLKLSMYTAPALLACAMNLLNACAIHKLFREIYAGVINVDSRKATQSDDDDQLAAATTLLPSPDRKAMLLCYATRFTQMFINTNLETLGAPLAMMMFAWTRSETVRFFSIAQGAMSFLALLTYIAFILFRIDKIINFRANLMLSLFALVLFHALTYSYPFLPGHVHIFSGIDPQNGTDEQVGCDGAKFSWCSTVRPLPPLYFYLCYIFFIGLAFPNINVTLNTLFSQIIGPRRQGTHQGFLQMSGGTARMVGPVVISSLYSNYGPQSAWLAEIAVTASTLALWFLLYRRMVPLAVPAALVEPEIESGKQPTESSPRSRLTRKRSREEKKPLVVPIEEEDGDEEGNDDGGGGGTKQLDRHNATVSTVASLGEV